MSYSTDWDIVKYRTKFESDEHWSLKREFLETHKSQFPEERLLCLAQVYVNIELLGCRYPQKIMEQMAVLSREVGGSFRERQKKRLKRTFVAASDAANARYKGNKRSGLDCETTSSPCDVGINEEVLSKTYNFSQKDLKVTKKSDKRNALNKLLDYSRIKAFEERGYSSGEVSSTERAENCIDRTNPLSQIVLVIYSYAFSNFYAFLHNTLEFSGMKLCDEFSISLLSTHCILRTDEGTFLACGEGSSKKEAKEKAAILATEKLLKICVSIKVQKPVAAGDNNVSLEQLGLKDAAMESNVHVPDDNVGAKLLKLMGWTGGALGKKANGIVQPIEASSRIGRGGLGLDSSNKLTKNFMKKVEAIILQYIKAETTADFMFPPDLSDAQRKFIHEKASRIGKGLIKTCSRGPKKRRCLILSRKLNVPTTLQMLLNEGGKTDKYEIFPPSKLTLQDLMDIQNAVSRK